ncbi:sulfite exporter TauE/SafE family protein [Tessaracoccus sp. G1721]|jgi:uncharacterized membrane protein YfcA
MIVLDVALLVLGAFVAAAVSGSAGFGGALLLLPLLTTVVGAEQAVPLLTVAQLVGNLSRVGFGVRSIAWRPVGLFLVGAIPASVAGSLLFVSLPTGLLTRSIGVGVLAFAVLKYFRILTFKPSTRLLLGGGALTGFLSGLIGSAGPLGAAVFLSLGLPPVTYVASEATTALAMHAVKTVVYGTTLTLDGSFWGLAAILGATMVAGTWVANRFLRRVSVKGFERYVLVLLATISIYLIIVG